MSLRFRIVFASACAVLAALLCVGYADGVRAEAERVRSEALKRYGGERVSLVVASVGLEPGDVVSRTNVSEREWIADLAPERAITGLEETLGREVSAPVPAGAPLTERAFRELDELGEVPAGHVALSLPITDRLGISRGIAQGTSLAGYAVTSEGIRLVASGMTVLSSPATGQTLAQTPQVTLAVRPADVTAVLAASATGDLRLVMPAADVEAAGELVIDEAPVLIDAQGDEAAGEGEES